VISFATLAPGRLGSGSPEFFSGVERECGTVGYGVKGMTQNKYLRYFCTVFEVQFIKCFLQFYVSTK
jgi:hypothetical protein